MHVFCCESGKECVVLVPVDLPVRGGPETELEIFLIHVESRSRSYRHIV